VGLVKELKLPPVVPALGKLLADAHVTVRRGVVDALGAIGTPGAMKQLEQALEDGDRDVRIATVRVFGTQGYRQALNGITAAVTGRKLRDADLTEKTAFFEAYGMLVGVQGLPTLIPMLGVRGVFRRKEDPETRACAAMAIGKIGTPEARDALERAAKDKDPLVRNAVNRAMQESAR
jgi:HEAT repeat protein